MLGSIEPLFIPPRGSFIVPRPQAKAGALECLWTIPKGLRGVVPPHTHPRTQQDPSPVPLTVTPLTPAHALEPKASCPLFRHLMCRRGFCQPHLTESLEASL